MAFLQGSSYELPIVVKDCNGEAITDEMVKKASFTIGEVTKEYDGKNGEVWFDIETQSWILPLTEEETFKFTKSVDWQARFLFNSGKTDGTIPKNEYVYDSINKTYFGNGGEDA